MADEEVITPTETPTETPPAEPETPAEVNEPEPHPLDPGGKRFAEVYGEMKEARRDAQDARERLARIEGQLAAKPQPKPAQIYTSAQLQAAVDTGKITPAQMSDQLAWQRAREAEINIERRLEDKQRNSAALNEINQYVDKIPALMQSNSPEFRKVAAIANEIASEMGRNVDDPLVQKRALREAMGSLEQISKVRSIVGASRNADTGTETRSGGGQSTTTTSDPLKDVPQMYKDHWNKLGYTKEQMLSEAKFIKPRRTR